MKTSELTGAALDWAVAKCEGRAFEAVESFMTYHDDGEMHYSTDWSQGGPIIEREGIRLHRSMTGQWWAGPESDPHRPVDGPTPLIAAMRCYVASRLGDTSDIPEELL